jgi:hypothetical protein
MNWISEVISTGALVVSSLDRSCSSWVSELVSVGSLCKVEAVRSEGVDVSRFGNSRSQSMDDEKSMDHLA